MPFVVIGDSGGIVVVVVGGGGGIVVVVVGGGGRVVPEELVYNSQMQQFSVPQGSVFHVPVVRACEETH